MQALFATGKSNTPLAWEEAPTPKLAHATDAIVRPLAVAACDLDRAIVAGRSPFPGRFMLGHEFTAEVIEVGAEVQSLCVGDVVLASFQPSCGTCSHCARHHSSVCSTVPNGTMYGIGATGGDWDGALADALRVPWADYNLARLRNPEDYARVASASDNLADGLRGGRGPVATQSRRKRTDRRQRQHPTLRRGVRATPWRRVDHRRFYGRLRAGNCRGARR